MGIKKNPFEVGYSGEDAEREVNVRCSCCAIPFTLRCNVAEKRGVPVCEHCVEHVKVDDEPVERRADRAEEHEERVRALLVMMSQRTAEQRDKAKRAQRWADSAQLTIDSNRSLINSISDLHLATSSGCSCGKKDCPTLKLLDHAFIRDRS